MTSSRQNQQTPGVLAALLPSSAGPPVAGVSHLSSSLVSLGMGVRSNEGGRAPSEGPRMVRSNIANRGARGVWVLRVRMHTDRPATVTLTREQHP